MEHGDPEVWALTYDINGNEYCTAKVQIDECLAWTKTQLDSVFTLFDDSETENQKNHIEFGEEHDETMLLIVHKRIHSLSLTNQSSFGLKLMIYECKQAQEVDGVVTGVVTHSGRYTWIDENDVKQYSNTPLTEAQYNKCKEDNYLHEPLSN